MMINTDIITTIEKFQSTNPQGVVVIRWATATGKSACSVQIAQSITSEIISSDSRQIFRYMNIGTDKVSKEIRERIPHHQIDIIDPDWFYTAGEWKTDTIKIIKNLHEEQKMPLIVWWTGLYVDTLYKNYSVPEVASDFAFRDICMKQEEAEQWVLWHRLNQIDPQEAKKHHPNSLRYIIRALEIYEKTGLTKTISAQEQPVARPMLMIWLRREREDTNTRIANRVGDMINSGLVDEVQRLLDQWYTKDLQSMQGIGYKETVQYLEGNISKSALHDLIVLHTQQYAKRQRTWFRRYINDSTKNPKAWVQYKVYTLE